ncbi:hypothetical protein AMATHDRAFT_3620 [Amanita thiersii Skay4041]|uniref:Uncharacterized protein n=1 Tax=Amanita thiersii Skay4041 TaxID=703135 RepID=A0A2A9NIE2_9AGAR|nr:hypothetical protein AMATHDRAFT_3620 [Amanita thiersii Skay4041]
MAPSSKSKPTTRNSIRQSLGKAFADVINKDTKDSDKSAKKSKEARRLSAVNLKPTLSRTPMGEVKPPSQPAKRTSTPESTALNRKRLSTSAQRSSPDEHPSKSNETTPQRGPVTRSATLRISTKLNTTSSALPKYRPKSAASDITKQSPGRASTRRRPHTSEDEKEDRQNSRENVQTASQKAARPISPLPHRALTNTNVVSSTPPGTPSRVKPATPSSNKSSPRPTKAIKTAATSTASQAAVNRPHSSSSSSCPATPHTPKLRDSRNSRHLEREKRPASVESSPRPSRSESPLTRLQRKVYDLTCDSPRTAVANMSHISEVTSEEEEDVALLLAPVADPSAPTPAMPRLMKARNRDKLPPITPTRPGSFLPSRAQMSYLSPLPPSDSSPAVPRPRSQKPSGNDRIPRGSILSWEQMASEASKTLGAGEVDNMLADIPAPFPDLLSPTASTSGLDIPESPSLSALNSPGGFGSISQVLLPDVTPSPAVHNLPKYEMNGELTTVDGAIVTLLRLQLAAAENTAKERLARLQIMEEEMHNMREEQNRHSYEMSTKLYQVETRLRKKEEDEKRMSVERVAYTASLEEQLREAQALREQTIQETIMHKKTIERTWEMSFKSRHMTTEAVCAARIAHAEWGSVRDLSEAELDMVRSDRHLLSIMLAELDRMVLLV